AAAALVAGAATLLSSGAAQAYPDSPNVVITIPDSVIYGGDTFDYAASADVECDWTVTYEQSVGAKTQTGSGDAISGTFDTKVVSKTYKSPVTALCKYDDDAQEASASAVVTLLPRGAAVPAADNGALPDTGGSNLWILVVGGGLLLVGGGLTYVARRRISAR
ncbi:MAG: LPXTG cell wall anchor domain-containing protein, partial [Aeromicrobium sp.]